MSYGSYGQFGYAYNPLYRSNAFGMPTLPYGSPSIPGVPTISGGSTAQPTSSGSDSGGTSNGAPAGSFNPYKDAGILPPGFKKPKTAKDLAPPTIGDEVIEGEGGMGMKIFGAVALLALLGGGGYLIYRVVSK